MSLRDYQTKSIDEIRAEFCKGNKKVLLWLATGAGKTVCFSEIVKQTVAKGKKAIIVVRGRKLVKQASERLFREQVQHGVMMANHWNYRPHLPVQVVSIDTAIARQLKPEADIIIIDEAHQANSDSYKEFLLQYHDTFIVAVTATPWVEGGLSHIANVVVHPISMQGLINEGHLVPFRIFAPSEPDLSRVEISRTTHDYVTNQLETAMVAGGLTGKVVDHYLKLAKELPALCNAVNINHSKLLVDKFIEAGVRAEHCDASTPDDERDAIIQRTKTGETHVICNVGIFSVGVDIPWLRAIIMARPTQSRNLFIQQAGRGTRPFDGKEECLLLDHAGNVVRHGFPTDEPEVDLSGRKRTSSTSESKVCKNCFAVYRAKTCPECGVEAPAMPRPDILESDEELRELKQSVDPILSEIKRLTSEVMKSGKKQAWAYHKLVQKFGFEESRKHLPHWFQKQYLEPSQSPFAKSPYRPVVNG